MKFEICLPNAMEGLLVPHRFAGVKEIGEFALLAERLGYHAVWGFDFINPACRVEIPDNETPQWYELMTTLAYLSGITDSVRLVAGVVVVPNRDTVLLAKQIAAVDHFSNGRLDFGIGLGGRKEFQTLQPRARRAHRGDILDEKLEALTLLLAPGEKPVSYKGKYVEFEDVQLLPKPMQQPLPILAAAETPAPLDRIAKWGLGAIVRDHEVELRRQQLAPRLAEHGRTLEEIEEVVWADISIKPTTEEAVENYIRCRMGKFRGQDAQTLLNTHWIGTVEQVAERLIRLKGLGVERVVAMHTATDTYQEMVEQTEILAREVMPLVESA